MSRRFVYFQGKSVENYRFAMLYSRLNGDMREYWVKTELFEVKIYEYDRVNYSYGNGQSNSLGGGDLGDMGRQGWLTNTQDNKIVAFIQHGLYRHSRTCDGVNYADVDCLAIACGEVGGTPSPLIEIKLLDLFECMSIELDPANSIQTHGSGTTESGNSPRLIKSLITHPSASGLWRSSLLCQYQAVISSSSKELIIESDINPITYQPWIDEGFITASGFPLTIVVANAIKNPNLSVFGHTQFRVTNDRSNTFMREGFNGSEVSLGIAPFGVSGVETIFSTIVANPLGL